jgi:curved DNA-binding protein CbpA
MLGFFKKKDLTAAEALGVLGLQMDASPPEIKTAYIVKMRQYHPDHGGSEFMAAKVNWARDILLPK